MKRAKKTRFPTIPPFFFIEAILLDGMVKTKHKKFNKYKITGKNKTFLASHRSYTNNTKIHIMILFCTNIKTKLV